MNYPEYYLCTVYNDSGAASLAKALLAHRDYKTRTLIALGWIPDDCTDFTGAAGSLSPRPRRDMAIE